MFFFVWKNKWHLLIILLAWYYSSIDVMSLVVVLSGFTFGIMTIPFTYYIFYKLFLRDEQRKKPIYACKVYVGEALRSQLSKQVISLSEQVKKDKTKKEMKAWGRLLIQMQGKKKERAEYKCALQGHTLFLFEEKGFIQKKAHDEPKEERAQAIVLKGALIKSIKEGEVKGIKWIIKLIHPSRCLLYKTDYIYLLTNDYKSHQRWYYALRSICTPYEELYHNPKLSANNRAIELFLQTMKEFRIQGKFNQVESLECLNIMLSRAFIHISESKKIQEKLAYNLAKSVAITIDKELTEKHLQSKLKKFEVKVTEVSIGTKPPHLSNFTLVEPENKGADNLDTAIELDLSYLDGDVAIQVESSLAIADKKVGMRGKLKIIKCEGRLRILLPPYPMSRFSVSFLKSPDLSVDIEVQFQTQKSANNIKFFYNQLRGILESKFKETFNESFVDPNAEWVLLPGVQENEPPEPKTETHISPYITNNLEHSDYEAEKSPLSQDKRRSSINDTVSKEHYAQKMTHRRSYDAAMSEIAQESSFSQGLGFNGLHGSAASILLSHANSFTKKSKDKEKKDKKNAAALAKKKAKSSKESKTKISSSEKKSSKMSSSASNRPRSLSQEDLLSKKEFDYTQNIDFDESTKSRDSHIDYDFAKSSEIDA